MSLNARKHVRHNKRRPPALRVNLVTGEELPAAA